MPPNPSARALCIGLGRAGALAIAALRRRADIEIVAGVDPDPASARAALPAGVPMRTSLRYVPDADIALVCTPTPTHVDVCEELFEHAQGLSLVLCEKPAALSAVDLAAVADSARRRGIELRVLLHYAYGSEVRWLADHLTELGEIASFSAVFEDPYLDELAERRHTLGSSWIDSGINALTVLSQVIDLDAVVASRADDDASETEVSLSGGRTGSIATSWRVAEPRKTTTFVLVDGTTVEVDHIGRWVTAAGRTVYTAPTDDPALRRYEAMIDAHLDSADLVDAAVVLDLHRLLAEGLVAQRA